MSVLIDTNVLARRAEPRHAQHRLAIDSVARLRAAHERLHVVPQNIAEMWSLLTRPVTANGLGFDVDEAQAAIDEIEGFFELLAGDEAAIHTLWRSLVVAHRVIGNKAYDTRLVAAMQVHGVNRILTFNTADFVRYPVEVLHP